MIYFLALIIICSGYQIGYFRGMNWAAKQYGPLFDKRSESLEKAYRKIDELKALAKEES